MFQWILEDSFAFYIDLKRLDSIYYSFYSNLQQFSSPTAIEMIKLQPTWLQIQFKRSSSWKWLTVVIINSFEGKQCTFCWDNNAIFIYHPGPGPLLCQMKMHSDDKHQNCLRVHHKSCRVIATRVSIHVLMYFTISVYKYIIIIHLFVYLRDNKSSKSYFVGQIAVDDIQPSVHLLFCQLCLLSWSQKQILLRETMILSANAHQQFSQWIEMQTITEKQLEMPIEIIIISTGDFI